MFLHKPVDILFHPVDVSLHQLHNGFIEPFPLAVGQIRLGTVQQLGKMAQAETYRLFHLFPELLLLDEHEKGFDASPSAIKVFQFIVLTWKSWVPA